MNIWIEFRKNEKHGGNGWNFSQSVWSPTRNKDNKKNAFL